MVDGVPILDPDAGVALSYQDIEGEDSGYDQAGNRHRCVIRRDAGVWGFNYTHLSEEEYAYIRNLFDGKDLFDFTHPDPKNSGKNITVKAYVESHSVSWYNAATKKFRNYKFNIIEAGDGEDEYV